jgi:hypothetical protein
MIFGTIERYLSRGFGIDATQLKTLHDMYLGSK